MKFTCKLNLAFRSVAAASALAAALALSAAGSAMADAPMAATAPAATPAAATATTVAPPTSSAQQLTSDAAYQISPGDVLTVNVLGFSDLTCEPAVTPDGMISVPLIGPIKVSGLTTDQTADMLAKKWTKWVINPPVTVAVKAKHDQLVSVYGYVNHPGTAVFTPNLHVLQALALVGGALPTGDLSKVTITHRTGQVQTVDLSNPGFKGGTPADVVLEEQDNVFVPENLGKFDVIGAVKQPGSYAFKDGTTVLDAITTAGGVATDNADLPNSTILHNGVEKKVDLTNLVTKGELSANMPLAPGDRVTIPVVYNRVYVFGEVTKPGYGEYKPGDRVLDALNSAGVMSDAQLYKVNVVRIDKVKNVAKLQVVDVESFLLRGDVKGNPVIQPGDALYVPQKKIPFKLQDMIGVLSSINVLNVGSKILTGTYLTQN